MEDPMEDCDTVILAGGRARRMGGEDKPGMDAGGVSLIERVASAAPGRTVIVGPDRERPAAVYVREDPPGGGPVPALRAGLPHVGARWVALLAGDLPFLAGADVRALRSAAAAAHGAAGAVMVDADGREQWLIGVWRTVALRSALADYTGASLRGLLGPMDPVGVPLGEEALAAFDCDTPDQLTEARGLLGGDGVAER